MRRGPRSAPRSKRQTCSVQTRRPCGRSPSDADMNAKDPNARYRIVADNRKARFNYEIGVTIEAGIVLVGTEVKSLRQGKATIGDAFAGEFNGEMFLYNAYIPEYL